jgi:hypothetical protein
MLKQRHIPAALLPARLAALHRAYEFPLIGKLGREDSNEWK